MGRGRVLVVEGDERIRVALREKLTHAGYQVSVVWSAEDGMRALRDETFDCLITDWRLPDLRGDVFHAFARLRQPILSKRTLFVVHEATDEVTRLIERCDCPVFEVPLDFAVLLAVVNSMTAEQTAAQRSGT
jgi:DNA-binding response OmpR family regulator